MPELETGATALAFASEELVAQTYHDFRSNRAHEKPAGSEVAFVTDNVQSAFDEAVAAGAIGLVTPQQKPWGQTVAYVRDLNGYLVELCSPIGA